MSSRGTANVLTRATAILAGLFFVTSLMLSILASMNRQPTSILGGSGPSAPISAPGTPASSGGEGGLLKQLQGTSEPATPPAPLRASGTAVEITTMKGREIRPFVI